MKNVVLLLLLAGCSYEAIEPTGVVIDCQTINDPCPDYERVDRILRIFENRVPGFDANEYLEITWYDKGYCLQVGDSECSLGATLSSHHIMTTLYGAIPHESMHVHLWRVTGDGDANHEESPGPWKPGATELAISIRLEAGETREE